MTVVPRFPPHQFMMLKCADQQVWDTVVDKYPVVKKISTHSRGRFSRYFVDSVVAYSTAHKDTELYALLDEAFLEVSKQTQLGKRFLSHQIGKTAQLAAISYTTSNAEFEPPLKKRKLGKDAVGADCMNVHFANLADEQVTKVVLRHGTLKVNGTCNEWVPRCAFPDGKEDMLLYLAVLGGKTYSCYYDHGLHIAHSTKFIFSEYMASNGLAFSKKTHAVKNDYATFENMVAHAIFCASRRIGVRGICFNHFFAGLLGDLQDEFKPMTLTMADSSETIAASDLLDEFTALTKLANATIPFLALPNAVWPKCILRADGCNFGHLVRVHDEERCDAFVEDVNRPGTPLFICECKYWVNNVGSDTMRSIIGRLEKLWGEEWAIVVLFCVDFVNLKKLWDHEEIGCVKITLETCCVRWIHQPPEGKKNKLVVVVEMGTL